jgi:hypothetical protein
MKIFIMMFLFFLSTTSFSPTDGEIIKWPDKIQVILDNAKPLEYELGNRLPLYLWPARNPGNLNDKESEILVTELAKRGIGIVSSWSMIDHDKSLSQSITVAKAQKKLGQRINIDATSLLYGFFNGDDSTAHIDENGNAFFDNSFGDNHKMGCPFTLDFRKNKIRRGIEYFVNKFMEEDLSIDFIWADWEIDGPLEVNQAYESSKKCSRCCKYLGDEFTFEEFQKKLREMRSYLQYFCYSSPVLDKFPHALVGNYGVYLNDGYRYWYDYFEYFVNGQPYKSDQLAKYRKWYNDFPLTGYSFGMPVVYPRWKIFTWYDFENTDYRWFYNMLLNASNAGKSTPQDIPIVSFVHYHTLFSGIKPPDPSQIIQMSKNSYQELLWHMLLRGTDTFFMYSGNQDEFPEEVRLVHEVYASAQKYGSFLDNGYPITYDVPAEPGVVISGLALGDSVLIRRTDFGTNHEAVEILAGTKIITVEYTPGVCKVLSLK